MKNILLSRFASCNPLHLGVATDNATIKGASTLCRQDFLFFEGDHVWDSWKIDKVGDALGREKNRSEEMQ
jgi:hypothetical protein